MLSYNPMQLCTTGERYEAQAPDTLDVADRMALAINALTNVWYPDEKWAMGLVVDFSRRPAVHYGASVLDGYLNIPPKFVEALTLCRLATGCTDSMDVDLAVLRSQLDLVGEDGLTYCPMHGLDRIEEARPYAEVWGEGRSLIALSMLAQVDDNPLWTALAKRKIDRMLALTREKEGFRFLWKGRFQPGENPPAGAGEPGSSIAGGALYDAYPVFSMMYSIGALGHGAGLFARLTGYEPALELSRGLARWAVARMFKNDDGRYAFHHFHHGLYALMATCQYGLAAGDRAVLERVDACYRWARAMGQPLIGFYAEHMPGSDQYLRSKGETVEICEVSDMVALALWLTRAGMGDYWDDVDRWVRNVYAEGQMRETSFLQHIPDSYFNPEPSPVLYPHTHEVARRSVGSFWGWMRANEGLEVVQTEHGPKLSDTSIMHCCTANGSRTLYYVWDSIVTKAAEEVRVNLLLNRASPWLDVDSYLPVDGKVVLRIKDAPKVAIRLPEWLVPGRVHIQVGGESRQGVSDGQWLRIGWLKPGDTVTLAFPVPEQVLHRVIGEMPYKLTLRGSNVTAIEPKGVACPLYEDQPTGTLVARSRFLPKTRNIVW